MVNCVKSFAKVNKDGNYRFMVFYNSRHGAVASASGYESVGPSSIPDEDGADPTQVFILHWSINGYLGQPREGKLLAPCPGVRDYSTTGSKAKETGDERPQPRADTA